jgi:hypothetical protein
MAYYGELCERSLAAAGLVRDPAVKARYLAYARNYSGLAFRLAARWAA